MWEVKGEVMGEVKGEVMGEVKYYDWHFRRFRAW